MASLSEIRSERLKKLEQLKAQGINPYPAEAHPTHTATKAIEQFDALVSSSQTVTLVGRIMALRGQGAILFFDLYDGTARFQAVAKKDSLPEEDFKLFTETIDIGDFIEVTGILFLTKREEKTIEVKSWRMLSKSLRPLPSEHYGLQDEEERYRKRYLDILLDPELRKLIELKAKFWDFTRAYLTKEGFIEVETPTLELTTGGAEANPFKTHHDDYDLDVYLRISVGELWQKRLLAAGLPKVFEIGRLYRNEGTSPEHAQEFTNLEFYAGYMDYREGMRFTEEMIKQLAQTVFGKLEFTSRGFTFNLAGNWPQLDYVSTVKDMTGIDVLTASEEDMKSKLSELKVSYEGKNRERLIDTLWKFCRKQITGPAWLINHPKLVSPLSKALPENPELTERAQLILAGAEVTNGFSELNDPIDQAARFALQQELIDRGDSEAMMPDDEFVEMLEYGMPPAFGFAYGDRLFAFLVDKPLRECQIFPLLRPKNKE